MDLGWYSPSTEDVSVPKTMITLEDPANMDSVDLFRDQNSITRSECHNAVPRDSTQYSKKHNGQNNDKNEGEPTCSLASTLLVLIG